MINVMILIKLRPTWINFKCLARHLQEESETVRFLSFLLKKHLVNKKPRLSDVHKERNFEDSEFKINYRQLQKKILFLLPWDVLTKYIYVTV